MKLSRAAKKLPFRHNCVRTSREVPVNALGSSSNFKSLDRTLSELLEGDIGKELRAGGCHLFVVVEGVYSMDGDVAPLTEIVRCVEQHLPNSNGYIMVDEAHSTGLFGEQGRGLVCELGLEEKVFARLHTFGKAMGSSGGEYGHKFTKDFT